MEELTRQRRTQLAIGQELVKYFQENNLFRISDLIKYMRMNSRTIIDWLEIYQRFNQGPKIRELKVNDHVVYEVEGKMAKVPQPTGKPTKLAPTKGIRRTKLQKAVAFEAFLTQQNQAFFRTTMEEALGMKSVQAQSWIALYQLFNQGPRVISVETKEKVTYRVEKI
jgi:hypothetical protein